MVIPQIKLETFHSILGSGMTKEWLEAYSKKLILEQPILNNYLISIREQFGQQAAFTGLMVFKMIESQLEVEALENLFAEEPYILPEDGDGFYDPFDGIPPS